MADFNNAPIVSAVNNADYLHITTSGGVHNRLLIQKLVDLAKSESLTATQASLLDKLADGCFIMVHNKSDNFPRAYKASAWTSLQNSGEIADGVLVVSGDKHIVVAPTGSGAIRWGSSGTLVASSGNYSSDREWAMKHFDGKARTAAIVSNSAYAGDGTDYAPGYANAYSRSNANGKGLTAGRWWLPSAGELMMMYANKQKINACLALITGAQQLVEGAHWSSSESSATYAWHLYLNIGGLDPGNKVSNSTYVRPVSAFLN